MQLDVTLDIRKYDFDVLATINLIDFDLYTVIIFFKICDNICMCI